MSAHRPVVWLFRSGEEQDPYEKALEEAGFESRSVPVLRFERLNEEKLRDALEHPKQYGGLVFTSPRAVESLVDAMSWLPSENATWHSKPIFVVGKRTAEEIRKAGFDPEGEESGSASLLAEYIAKRSFEQPLLFLCGDRRRDELPQRLEKAGVALDELCVYKTLVREEVDLRGQPQPDWVVFFSPSGLEAIEGNENFALHLPRIAAIGPTTAAELREAGYNVDAVADEPSPQGVAAAILAAAE